MLVRGHRIETEEVRSVRRVTADAVQIEPIIVAPFVSVPMFLILLVGLMLPKPKKRKEKG
jgi:sortase A